MSRTSPAKGVVSPKPADPHRVVMLGFPDAQILDITGPLEVFARGTRWLRDKGITRNPAYTVELVAPKAGPFAVSSGLRMVAERSYRDVSRVDTLLVAGGLGVDAVMEDADMLGWIRRMAPKVRRLGSVCTGALILARAGLLENKAATTHWNRVSDLEGASPSIHVHGDDIYVRDGKIYTSAGVTAGMDMALAMLEEDWGQPAALGVAQALVMFLKRPGGQSQFSGHLAAQFSENNRIRELQLWMLDHLQEDLSVSKLAAKLAMSDRNFARRFRETVGTPPAQYVSSIRLEAARRRLEASKLPVSQVARRSGFGTQETMRRTFIAELGISPSDYRERFRGASP